MNAQLPTLNAQFSWDRGKGVRLREGSKYPSPQSFSVHDNGFAAEAQRAASRGLGSSNSAPPRGETGGERSGKAATSRSTPKGDAGPTRKATGGTPVQLENGRTRAGRPRHYQRGRAPLYVFAKRTHREGVLRVLFNEKWICLRRIKPCRGYKGRCSRNANSLVILWRSR